MSALLPASLPLGTGWLLPADGPPRRAALAVREGCLAAGSLPDEAGAAPELIAFAGLVNSHAHLEFDCYPRLGCPPYPDDEAWARDIHARHAETIAAVESLPLADRARWGIARNALCGVTKVVSHGLYPERLFKDAPIDVLTGADFQFIHSLSAHPGWRRALLAGRERDPVVLHLAEGGSQRAQGDAARLRRWNLRRRRIVAVHGVALREDEARHLEALVWCPASNQYLFGRTADVARLAPRTRILFGTDSTLTAAGTLFDQLRLARASRALDDAALFAAVGSEARAVWSRIPRRAGASDAGPPDAPCDFVVARSRAADPWDAFYALRPEDLVLVVKQGRILVLDPGFAAGWPALARAGDDLHELRVGTTTKRVYDDIAALCRRLARAAPPSAAQLSLDA